MKRTHLAAVASLGLLASCSVDVAQPPGGAGRRYELVVTGGGEGGTQYLLLDTGSGALYERDGDQWKDLVDAVDD